MGTSLHFAPTPYNTYVSDPFGTISTPDHSVHYEDDPIIPVLSHDGVDTVPYSTKPVPAPPMVLRHSDSKIIDGLRTSSSSNSRGDDEISYVVDKGMRQEDIDAHRLQQLGYDPVLGRDYTFWSSLAISACNIGCLQVRDLSGFGSHQGVIFSVYGTYTYGGPTFIVGRLCLPD